MPKVVHSADGRTLGTPVTTMLVATGAAAAVGAAFVISPDHVEDGPVICPLRRLTGLPCPGCGLTRSWVYQAHGQWHEAFAAHPFGLILGLAAIALVLAVAGAVVRGRQVPDLDELVRRPWIAAVIAAWLAFAVVRLAVAV